MPNIKSQIKRVETSKAANLANNSAKSECKTAIKKVEALAAEGKKDEAVEALANAISLHTKASSPSTPLPIRKRTSKKWSPPSNKRLFLLQASPSRGFFLYRIVREEPLEGELPILFAAKD